MVIFHSYVNVYQRVSCMEVEAVNGRANSQLMFLLIIGRQYTAMYSIYTMYVYIYRVYNDAGHVHVYIPIIIIIHCIYVSVSMSF